MWNQEDIAKAGNELKTVYKQPFELVRQGPSLLFRSGDSKIAARLSHPKSKDLRAVELETSLISWLWQHDVATIEPLGEAQEIGGCPALVYHWIEEDDRPLSWLEFGVLVKKLHGLEAPPWLPDYSQPSPYRERLAPLIDRGIVSWDEARFIFHLGDQGMEGCRELNDSEKALIHGDLHTGNLLSGHNGLILIDWEGAARGSVHVDFSSILQRPRLFSLSADDLAAFEEGYGQSIEASSETEAMIDVRIANSITHLLLGDESRVIEGRKRLEDVMSESWGREDFAVRWRDV